MNAAESGIDALLRLSGWAGARQAPLAGDASPRRYWRLTREGETALVMDTATSPIVAEAFVRIGALLRSAGLAAPKVLAVGPSEGLLLVEDFGDDSYTALLQSGHDPAPLYRLAVDVLIALHRHFHSAAALPAELPHYDLDKLVGQSRLFADVYVPHAVGKPSNAPAHDAFVQAMRVLLAAPFEVPQSLLLRDFHAGNLIWRGGQDGLAACGLIDFEEAGLGPIAYDLVSLLQDARLDLPESLEADCKARYLAAFPALDNSAFERAYQALAAQRHLRVLAVFARLAAVGEGTYLAAHEARLWRYLERQRDNPAAAGLLAWLSAQGLPRRP